MLYGMSSTIEQLQKLADDLTEVSPPPIQPIGLNGVLPHSGKWIVVKVGSGLYAVRPEYEDGLGGVIVGKHNDEVKGFAPAVMTAQSVVPEVTVGHQPLHPPNSRHVIAAEAKM